MLWADESKFELFGTHGGVFVRRRKEEKFTSGYVVPTMKHVWYRRSAKQGGLLGHGLVFQQDNGPKHAFYLCKR